MTNRTKYVLKDLLKQCDPNAPMPQAVRDWDNIQSVGREKYEDVSLQNEASEWSITRPKSD